MERRGRKGVRADEEPREDAPAGGALREHTRTVCGRPESWQWEEKQQADGGSILDTDCEGLAIGLCGKREGSKERITSRDLLNEQTVGPLTDMGRAGGEAGFMSKTRVLLVRCQHTEAEQGAGRAERKKGTQADPGRKRFISKT